jgi:cytochrome c-type biogenesis protein
VSRLLGHGANHDVRRTAASVSWITERCGPSHVGIAERRDILVSMETLVATFLLGLGSAASPCLLPLYPGFVAYLAGTDADGPRRREAALLGLAVLAGLLTTMILVGLLLSFLALPIGDVLRWSVPIATVVLVVLGLVLLAGRNPFTRLATVRVPVVRNPLAQAFVYGVLVGPVALPCAGPFLVALLAISVGLADGLSRVGSFVVYGLGFGLPLVALSAIDTARGRALSQVIARHHRAVLRAAGALLIATALYELLAAGLL